MPKFAGTYEQAKAVVARLTAAEVEASAALRKFPRGPTGLTPDDVKFSTEYRATKARYEAARVALRNFNGVFVKQFAKEYRDERRQPDYLKRRFGRETSRSCAVEFVDPIKLARKQEAARALRDAEPVAETAASTVPYEVPLVPPAGSQVVRTTCVGARGPIPVLYDPRTRITYPIQE